MESKQIEIPSSLAAASFPLLVYEYGEQPDNSQIMFAVADGTSCAYQVSELSNYRCVETPSGLVLVVDTASLQSFLWNPQTGEKIALPAMDKALPEHCRCLLSDAVSSPDCLVLVYNLAQPELLFCQVRGSTAWMNQSYDIGLCEIPNSDFVPYKMTISCMAAVEDKFYFLDTRDVVGVLSLTHDPEPHFEMTTFDATLPSFVSEAQQKVTLPYLLESSHELFIVCLFFHGCSLERIGEVGAYRMDFSSKKWCKVTDIGDTAFLLGPTNFAASCPAMEHGLKRSCVYFAYDFLGDSNSFHIFDLQEGTRELAGPTQDIPVLSRKPFWMVPVLSLSFR